VRLLSPRPQPIHRSRTSPCSTPSLTSTQDEDNLKLVRRTNFALSPEHEPNSLWLGARAKRRSNIVFPFRTQLVFFVFIFACHIFPPLHGQFFGSCALGAVLMSLAPTCMQPRCYSISNPLSQVKLFGWHRKRRPPRSVASASPWTPPLYITCPSGCSCILRRWQRCFRLGAV